MRCSLARERRLQERRRALSLVGIVRAKAPQEPWDVVCRPPGEPSHRGVAVLGKVAIGLNSDYF